MKTVELIEKRPFRFKETFTWFDEGSLFEVLEEKELPMTGLGYKIKDLKFGCIMDGWNTAKDFKVK